MFLPSVALTMIGILAISMGLVIRSHALQLEAEKEVVLARNTEVTARLRQSVEARKGGYFLSVSKMEELLSDFCAEMSDGSTKVSVLLLDTAQYPVGMEGFVFAEETRTIQFHTVTFIPGFVCKVSVSKNVQPLLDRFQEDIRTVQVYGTTVSMIISTTLLLLAIVITKPIKGLEKATEKIAEGDYSHRVRYRGSDELAELARHMNEMAAHIEADTAYIEGISDSRRKFISNMTHELKTPLTSILGFADVLRIKMDITDEEKKNYADIIFAEANRLRMLSSRLMELITVNEIELHMAPVKLEELLAREADMYRPICVEAGISLTLHLEPVVVWADETLFATMIVNLIDNARKASGSGKEIHISCQKKAHQVMVQVRDQGIGIPKDQIVHVTEAFYMVDKARTRKAGGAGIGLALCKAVATAHHGELMIESKLHEGTTVTVTAPLYEEGGIG